MINKQKSLTWIPIDTETFPWDDWRQVNIHNDRRVPYNIGTETPGVHNA